MQKPSLEEVQQYCAERQNGVGAQKFIDYYEMVGWKVGKTCKPMVSWKAAVRQWEQRDRAGGGNIMQRLTDRSWAS